MRIRVIPHLIESADAKTAGLLKVTIGTLALMITPVVVLNYKTVQEPRAHYFGQEGQSQAREGKG